jgi:hypothetical protein
MADQGTAARLIEVATAELGTIEGPKDNETKYGAYTKANFQPWCGSFVNWCGNEAGVKIPNTVYTPSGAQAFKKSGAWIDGDLADPEPGDIAYFDFPSDGVDRISHVGIVVKDNEDGTVWCIEGNTSGIGDQRNGGMVMVKERFIGKEIVGFARPKYLEYAGEFPVIQLQKTAVKEKKK